MTEPKPPQAPSEEALSVLSQAELDARNEWYHQNPGIPHLLHSREFAVVLTKHQAIAFDAFAAQRLTAALLDPSEEVVEAMGRAMKQTFAEPVNRWLQMAGVISADSQMPPWDEDCELWRKQARAALRAAAMKITGRTD